MPLFSYYRSLLTLAGEDFGNNDEPRIEERSRREDAPAIVVGNVIHVPFRSFGSVRPKAIEAFTPVSEKTMSDDERLQANFKESIARVKEPRTTWDPIEEVVVGRGAQMLVFLINNCWLV